VLVKPGKMGPNLLAHPVDAPCSMNATQRVESHCGAISRTTPRAPGRLHLVVRGVTLQFLADSLSGAENVGRPILDRTGLSGTFDFTLEWAPGPGGLMPLGADEEPDPTGPTFVDALRDQLGLKLESAKGSVEVIVIDHLERPSEN
jgi:uncharacterized protein (TIGR03435 family)